MVWASPVLLQPYVHGFRPDMSEECAAQVAALFSGTASSTGLDPTQIASTLCAQFASAAKVNDDALYSLNAIVIGLNTQYMVWAGALVFIMHAGASFIPSFNLSFDVIQSIEHQAATGSASKRLTWLDPLPTAILSLQALLW